MNSAPVIAAAHRCVAAALRPGDRAVDATAGNGHDTVFLAERVGPRGQVLAVDNQEAAVASTRRRLQAAGIAERVTLCCTGHQRLADSAPGDWTGTVRGILFNLGFLPGGDKSRITRPATTLEALETALFLLAPGGRLAVVAYPGHPGGAAEAVAVAAWVGHQAGCDFRRLADGRPRLGRGAKGPRLSVLERRFPGAHPPR